MKSADHKRKTDQIVRLLRLTEPFQALSNNLLKSLAQIVRFIEYEKGEVIYEIGAPAEDIYIIVFGQVRHSFAPSVSTKELINELKAGDLFGWAGLFKIEPHGHSKRLAKTICLEQSEVMAINCAEFVKLAKAEPAAYDLMMKGFMELIVREFSVPANLLGFIDLNGESVQTPTPHSTDGNLSSDSDKRFLY